MLLCTLPKLNSDDIAPYTVTNSIVSYYIMQPNKWHHDTNVVCSTWHHNNAVCTQTPPSHVQSAPRPRPLTCSLYPDPASHMQSVPRPRPLTCSLYPDLALSHAVCTQTPPSHVQSAPRPCPLTCSLYPDLALSRAVCTQTPPSHVIWVQDRTNDHWDYLRQPEAGMHWSHREPVQPELQLCRGGGGY